MREIDRLTGYGAIRKDLSINSPVAAYILQREFVQYSSIKEFYDVSVGCLAMNHPQPFLRNISQDCEH
jgi:hypothetical protein